MLSTTGSTTSPSGKRTTSSKTTSVSSTATWSTTEDPTSRSGVATAVAITREGRDRSSCQTIGYLKGQRTPKVEKGDADFDMLGVRFRVIFDLGVREQDQSGTRLEVGFTWHRGAVTTVA